MRRYFGCSHTYDCLHDFPNNGKVVTIEIVLGNGLANVGGYFGRIGYAFIAQCLNIFITTIVAENDHGHVERQRANTFFHIERTGANIFRSVRKVFDIEVHCDGCCRHGRRRRRHRLTLRVLRRVFLGNGTKPIRAALPVLRTTLGLGEFGNEKNWGIIRARSIITAGGGRTLRAALILL